MSAKVLKVSGSLLAILRLGGTCKGPYVDKRSNRPSRRLRDYEISRRSVFVSSPIKDKAIIGSVFVAKDPTSEYPRK